MALTPAHNPTDTAVTVDADGRQVAPDDWGVVDDSAAEVTAAVGSGRLRLYAAHTLHDGAGQNPAAVAAARAAEAAEARRQAFAGLPAGQLSELAQSALGLSKEDAEADTGAALRALALSPLDIPAPRVSPPPPDPEPGHTEP